LKRKILILDHVTNPNIESEILGNEFDVTCLSLIPLEEQNQYVNSAHGLLVWHQEIDSDLLNKLHNCKIIVRYGTGFDNVDLKVSRALGIDVCNTPDYGIDEVADATCAMILNFIRQIKYMSNEYIRGNVEWAKPPRIELRRTSEHKLGVIGLGRIGSSVALKMKAFGISVGFYDPYVSRGIEKSYGIKRFESLEELQKNSSIITVHTPLTSETNSFIDENFISNLNLQTILINNSRGGLFKNLDILLDGLKSNQISFLGLDVVPEEPLNININFFKTLGDNSNEVSSRIILTPHLSYYSEQSWPEMRTKAALNVKNALNGSKPLNIVN
jgi:C-terminal binding protein